MILASSAEVAEQRLHSAAPTKMRFTSSGKAPAVLADVFQEDINIAIWKRQLPLPVQETVNGLIASDRSVDSLITLPRENARGSVCESLGTHQECLFSQDVAELVEMFCLLLGLKRVALRLRMLDGAMCPKFHVDRVPCRLITTYYGAGTEWLPHDAVDRSKLGPGSLGQSDLQSGLLKTKDDIQQLNRGDVAVLKGELWEDNENAGLVHRSPEVPAGDVRLLLSIDVSN